MGKRNLILEVGHGKLEQDENGRSYVWVCFGKTRRAKYWLEPKVTMSDVKGELYRHEIMSGFAMLENWEIDRG